MRKTPLAALPWALSGFINHILGQTNHLNSNKRRSFVDFNPTSLKIEAEKRKFKKSLEIFQIHSINFSSLFNFVHFVARQSLGAVASVCLECQKSPSPSIWIKLGGF